MKKAQIQKAEEYLQKAKDILNSILVEDEFDELALRHYTDVKSIKKAGRTAWKGCAIALNYALEKSIETYDYNAFKDGTREINHGLYCVFDSAYCMLVYYMSGDGTQIKFMCDESIKAAEQLIDMCKNIQSIIERSEEEKRDREERLKKNESNKKEVRKQSKELLELLLKKTGTKRKDLIDLAYQEFVSENLGLLTDEEKRHFDHLVF